MRSSYRPLHLLSAVTHSGRAPMVHVMLPTPDLVLQGVHTALARVWHKIPSLPETHEVEIFALFPRFSWS
ncbi:hypothetical protein SDRG_11070, partial [Saprolegnia diclina VS20]